MMEPNARKSVGYKLVRETNRVFKQIRNLPGNTAKYLAKRNGAPAKVCPGPVVHRAPVEEYRPPRESSVLARSAFPRRNGHVVAMRAPPPGSCLQRRVLVMMGEAAGTFYDYQALAICRALEKIGAKGVQLRTPHVSAIHQTPPVSVLKAIQECAATDVLTINIPLASALRQEALPAGVQWHTWVQDLYDSRLHLPLAESETRWNWVKRWGDPYLQPATEHGRYYRETEGYDFDVSFCGFYTTVPLELPSASAKQLRNGERILREVFRLWEEDRFNYQTEWKNIHRLWNQAEERAGVRVAANCLGACLYYVASQAARRSQRQRMARAVAALCEKHGWRFALIGLNWDREFPRHARPFVGPGEELARVFQRSKISLHVNGEVLYHNRLLEIFASGGFGLSWVPGDEDDGGLHTPLTNLACLEDDLKYWLGSDAARRDEIARVGDLVRREHSYEVRMKKLLGDGGTS